MWSTAPRFKFLLKLFSKSLRFPKAAPWSLSAESEMTTGFSFWLEQERARWAMKRVRSTEKTRSIECVFSVQGDYVFDRASLFLLALLRQKKKRYGRRSYSKRVCRAASLGSA